MAVSVPPRHWTPADLAVRKAVGMGLAIGGNLLISLGLNVQKYVHNARERRSAAERRRYTAMPLWWVGFGLTLGGELGNFAAYGFAEAALVTPLGAVAVVANAFIAALALREGLRPRDVGGCALVVAGSVVVASSTRMHGELVDPETFVRYATAPPFLAYSAALLVAIAAAAASVPRYGHVHVACYVTLCSLIGSVTVMAAKGLSSFLNAWAYGGDSPFAQPLCYLLMAALLATALLQTRYLNLAMEHFGNTETVPVFFVAFTISTVTASSVLYRDFDDEGAAQIAAFALGCLVTFAGVKLITSNRHRRSSTGVACAAHLDGAGPDAAALAAGLAPPPLSQCASAEFENPLLVLSASLLGEPSHHRRAHGAHSPPPPPHDRELGTAPLRIADAPCGGAALDVEAAAAELAAADGGDAADASARLIGDGHARSSSAVPPE